MNVSQLIGDRSRIRVSGVWLYRVLWPFTHNASLCTQQPLCILATVYTVPSRSRGNWSVCDVKSETLSPSLQKLRLVGVDRWRSHTS